MATKERSKGPLGANISDAEIERQTAAARKRHQAKRKAGLVAVSARYDPMPPKIEVQLSSGLWFGFPIGAIHELRDATPQQIAMVRVDELGSGLVWEELDVQVSVMGMLMQLLGQHVIMTAAGRAGGKVSTERKAAAARANGAKGGRPRKTTSAK